MSEQQTLDSVSGDTALKVDEIRSSLDETSAGTVPNDWERVRLEDVVLESEYGAAESSEDFDSEKPRYVRITDINSSGRLKPETKVSLSKQKADGYRLGKGDLLFARSGASVGKTYLYRQMDEDCAYAGYLIRHKVNQNLVNSEYLYQYTDSPNYNHWVERIQRTGAQPNINAREYGDLLIPYPPLEEQRKIATVLYTVDQAIQKTEEIEAQIRRTRKGIVQDVLTFGLSKSDVSDTGTVLGRLPEHWEVASIDEIVANEDHAFTDGARYSLSSAEIHDEGDARAILLQEVGEGEFNDTEPKFATAEMYDEITHRAIYPGEVVVAKMAEPVARACIVPNTYDKYLLGCADVVRVLTNDEFDDRFLMYCMNSHKLWSQAVAHLRGTGRSRINLENISELKVPKPPLHEQVKIAEAIQQIDRRIENEQDYQNQLQRLKQGLMQDLLSGAVRTHDTEIDILDEVLTHG